MSVPHDPAAPNKITAPRWKFSRLTTSPVWAAPLTSMGTNALTTCANSVIFTFPLYISKLLDLWAEILAHPPALRPITNASRALRPNCTYCCRSRAKSSNSTSAGQWHDRETNRDQLTERNEEKT